MSAFADELARTSSYSADQIRELMTRVKDHEWVRVLVRLADMMGVVAPIEMTKLRPKFRRRC